MKTKTINKLKYLYHSHLGRLISASTLFLIGGVFGTNGVFEIETNYCFMDVLFWIGTFYLVGYTILAIVYAWIRAVKS